MHHPMQDDSFDQQFEELFYRYKNVVLKTAYLILGSSQEADDVLQDVFLRVYGSLASYDPSKGAFTTWLYRITMNTCLNRKRSFKFLTVSLTNHLRGSAFQVPSAESQIGDVDDLAKALGRLSEKYRAVIVLRYYHDLPLSEIADILGLPVGTVKSRLNKALEKLKHSLEVLPFEAAQKAALNPRKLTNEVQ